MELSVREAATLLGRSPRTVRAQLARGELPGRKVKGSWRIHRRDLPLTEVQRAALQQKADAMRGTLEEALPSRLATNHGHKGRSLADLDAFRLGARVLTQVRATSKEELPQAFQARLEKALEETLFALAEAAQQFDRDAKRQALHRARGLLARSIALLLLEGEIPPCEPLLGWLHILEGEMAPAVAGFARWADKLGRQRR